MNDESLTWTETGEIFADPSQSVAIILVELQVRTNERSTLA